MFSFLGNDNFILDMYAWNASWLHGSISKCSAYILPTFIPNKKAYELAFLTIQYIVFIMIITIDFINAVAFYFYIIFETYSEKLSLKYKWAKCTSHFNCFIY